MAYETGTAASDSDLFNKIVTFLTTTAGWTLLDTLSAGQDVVISSDGEDGKANNVFRLTRQSGVSTADKITDRKLPDYDAHNAYDYITVRGYRYWNTATNTGVGEYGKWGPFLLTSSSGTGVQHIDLQPTDDFSKGPYTLMDEQISNNSLMAYDYHRRFYFDVGNSNLYLFDLGRDMLTQEGGPNPIANTTFGQWKCPMLPVFDKATDKTFLYAAGSTATKSWVRIDPESGSESFLSQPSWTTGTDNCNAMWDGGDFIYLPEGDNTTTFDRYSISGDSWLGGLAACPVTWSSSWDDRVRTAVYVPADAGNDNSSGQLQDGATGTGSRTDAIFALLSISGTVLYRYNVNNDTWENTITLPANKTSNSRLEYDGGQHLYFMENIDSGAITHRLDLKDIGSGWTSVGGITINDKQATGTMFYVDPYIGKVKSHNTTHTYYISATLDTVSIVTVVQGNYYWVHFGCMNSYLTDNGTMEVTSGPVGPGSAVTIGVDDSSGYKTGDPIFILDKTTGTLEATSIFSVPDGTSIKADLVGTFPSGSLVGTDPCPGIITSDMYLATTAFDRNGYRPDGQSSWYKIRPAADTAVMELSAQNIDGYNQPWPMVVYQGPTKDGIGGNVGSFQLSTRGVRGSLRNIYTIVQGSFPKAGPLDELIIGGSRFKIFPLHEHRDCYVDPSYILIGPID